MDTIRVPISVAQCWQRFMGCEPDYIEQVCHAKCCDAPSRPGGAMVTIHRSEQAAIEARGGFVGDDGMLLAVEGCVFKDRPAVNEHPTYLCTLHETPDKPFGCIASPFTLNANGTLVVRNRYRMLPCYLPRSDAFRTDHPPVYIAFRASLDLIFGDDEADRICRWLDEWGDPDERGEKPPILVGVMPHRSYEILRANDAAKKS